jgi:hypothetical protein
MFLMGICRLLLERVDGCAGYAMGFFVFGVSCVFFLHFFYFF